MRLAAAMLLLHLGGCRALRPLSVLPVRRVSMQVTTASPSADELEQEKLRIALRLRGGLVTVSKTLNALSLFGNVVFAFSGTIAAGRAGMDLLGCAIIACVTSMGGGTLRDVMLGRLPVFWMRDPRFLKLCLLTSVATFAFYPRLEGRNSFSDRSLAVCLSDAFGMAAFAVLGSAVAYDIGRTDLICIVCGLISASFGGVIRDNLCGIKPRLLHANRSMYGTPAIVGALAYTLARRHVASEAPAALLGFGLALCLRVYCFTYQIMAPPGCSTLAGSPSRSHIAT